MSESFLIWKNTNENHIEFCNSKSRGVYMIGGSDGVMRGKVDVMKHNVSFIFP
jgi:hypothetical protein